MADIDMTSAQTIVDSVLKSWGLSSLANVVLGYMKDGDDLQTAELRISDTPEYKKRFAGNATRRANGLQELSPADYVATETALKTVLRQWGVPDGLYNTDDLIGNNVSAQEADTRLSDAQDVWSKSAPASVRQAYLQQNGLTNGDVLAGILDPDVAIPVLQRKVTMAQIGGAGIDAGVNVSTDLAGQLADAGVTQSQAQQGLRQVSQALPSEQAAGNRFGESIDSTTAIKSTLLGDAQSTSKINRVNRSERNLFGGMAGATTASLNTNI